MKMILNNDTNKVISLSNYYRNANYDSGNKTIVSRLELNFNGNYAGNAIDYLTEYLNQTISSIQIFNEADAQYVNISGINGQLNAVYENGSDEGRNGNATILIYIESPDEEEE